MVAPGGTVYVCPALQPYAEQVSISINVNLIGLYKGSLGPTIAAPVSGMIQNSPNSVDLFDGTPVAAQILVTGGKTVNISGFTLDGSNKDI